MGIGLLWSAFVDFLFFVFQAALNFSKFCEPLKEGKGRMLFGFLLHPFLIPHFDSVFLSCVCQLIPHDSCFCKFHSLLGLY